MSVAASPFALELRHVSVTLEGRRVVDDVSATFERHAVVAVVGRSGAGKSVLMKAAAGLLPCSGEVVVRDPPLVFVHQDPALLDDLDVEENVAFAVARMGLAAVEVQARVASCLRALDLEAVRGAAPARLPLATQKRVALARALALAPQTLIVDEPTTGLDPVAADTVDAALAALCRARSLTLIVITHSPRTVRALRPRLLVIEAGRAQAGAEVRP